LITLCDKVITIAMPETEVLESSLLERLFSSRVRIQLLSAFLLHPEEPHHIRALASKVDAHYSAVWRELKNLEKAGLLRSESVGGRKLYQLNPEFPILSELRRILLKTVGAGDLLRKVLSRFEGIEAAFIFGSFAEGEQDAESDLDLMILGEVDLAKLSPVVEVLFTKDEWESRLAEGDAFASDVRDGSKVMLIGKQDAL